MYKHVTGIMMIQDGDGSEFEQMGAGAGIKAHGDRAVAAIIREYEQLRDMETVEPLKVSSL